MIQLECSNCRAMLSIDDAFAGGVCRCQQCGTIQTVPKRGEPATAAAASQKALFKRKARIESALSPYSDGLDRAADELGSSGGLSASELANINATRRTPGPNDSAIGQRAVAVTATPPRTNGKPATQNAPSQPPVEAPPPRSYVPRPSKSAAVPAAVAQEPSSKKPLILVGGIAAAVLVIGVIWWLIPSSAPKADAPTKTQPQAAATATETPVRVPDAPTVQKVELPPAVIEIKPRSAVSASICGLTIEGNSVVYILDRSGCTQSAFRQMTDTCLKSAESLGSSRKFQIAVWNSHKELSFPATGLAAADAVGIDGARKAIADTYSGSTDISTILAAAKTAGASDIVLVSAVDIDDVNTQSIHEALSGQQIKFHAIAVGKDLSGERVRALTAKFSGGFKQVDLDSLN